MFEHEKKVLTQIIEKLRKRLPERIISVYAFGSRVRGNHSEWSDFDVLVIVKDKTPKLETEVISIFVDEEIKSGLSFALVVKDVQAFEMEKKFDTPFYKNIMVEGILI